MRTSLKKEHKNRKNAKMNSSTQKCFTLKNVWKMMTMKIEENNENPKMGQLKKSCFRDLRKSMFWAIIIMSET